MALIFQFLKLKFLRLVITLFISLAPIIVMVQGGCCLYIYYVNVRFHRRRKIFQEILV